MANRRRIATLLLHEHGWGSLQNGRLVYHPAVEGVVSGILIEGTPYKDTVYAHRYVQAFFTAQDRIYLNYAIRFARADGGDFFEGPDTQIADGIAATLSNTGAGEAFNAPMDARGFISWLDDGHARGPAERTAFDLGAAHVCLGDGETAATWFETARAQSARSNALWGATASGTPFASDLQRCLDGSADPAPLRDALLQNARENAAALGFQPRPGALPGAGTAQG